MMTDKLTLGEYYSIDFLKNGTLYAPSLSNLFGLVPVADGASINVNRLDDNDTSEAYQVVKKPLSFAGDGIVATTYLDDAIITGETFYGGEVKAVTAGADYYVLDPTLCEGKVFKLPVTLICTAGFAIVKLYEGTDYDISIPIGLFNRNRLAGDNSKVSFGVAAIAGSTKGVLLPPLLFGTDSTNQNVGGGAGAGSNSIILDNTKKYLLETTYSDNCTALGRLEIVET